MAIAVQCRSTRVHADPYTRCAHGDRYLAAGNVFARATIALIVVSVLLAGCVQKRTMILPPVPGDVVDKSEALIIDGTFSVAGQPHVAIAGKAERALAGFAAGAAGALGAGGGGGQAGGLAAGADALSMALALLAAPFYAVAGAVSGGVATPSRETSQAAVAALERIYTDRAALELAYDRVFERTSALGFRAVLLCDASGADGLQSRREAPPGSTARQTDCSGPGNRLTLNIVYRFVAADRYAPELWFEIEASVRVGRSPATHPLALRWLYVSPKLDLFLATAADAAWLRSELTDAQYRLAEAIVLDIYLAPHAASPVLAHDVGSALPSIKTSDLPRGLVTRVPTESALRVIPQQARE